MTTKTVSPLDLAAVAVHECGHAAAAALRGATITDCIAYDAPRDGSYGHTRYVGLGEDHQTFIGYSGPWFEARCRAAGDDPDPRAIRASLAHNVSDRCDLDSTEVYGLPRSYENEYAALWPAVTQLAALMLDRPSQRIEHGDVLAALGIKSDGSNRALVASLVRAGCRIDSFAAA